MAFTLIEMVVSLAIISLLMVAMGSAVTLMARAVPSKDSPTRRLSEAQAALDELLDEARHAVYVTEASATVFAFTLPDRNGDGAVERVRYSWSGTAGARLKRSYNGVESEIGPKLASLTFATAADVKPREETYPGYLIVGPVDTLDSYGGAVDAKTRDISSNDWIAQPILLTPPPRAVSWKATTVLFYATPKFEFLDLGLNSLLVQVRPFQNEAIPNDWAGATPVGEGTLPSSIWTGKWVTLSNAPSIPAGTNGVLMIGQTSASGSNGTIQYDDKAPSDGRNYFDTDGAGDSWDREDKETLRFLVRGQWTTRSPDQGIRRDYRTRLTITMTPQGEGVGALTTSLPLLNAPEVLQAVWETDFSSDPTRDLNGDNVGDWAVRSGNSAGLLAGLLNGLLGTGSSTETLDTRPVNDFTAPVTAKVRFQASGSTPVKLCINADWSGSNAAPLVVELAKPSSSAQTLTVRANTAETATPVVRDNLSTEMQEVRLVIDPSRDTVAVWLNKGWLGTYRYVPQGQGSLDKFASLVLPNGASVDSVSIRVGGTPQ